MKVYFKTHAYCHLVRLLTIPLDLKLNNVSTSISCHPNFINTFDIAAFKELISEELATNNEERL